MNIWPAGKYDHDPTTCHYVHCELAPIWIVRPSTPAFAAPQFGACATHLEAVLRRVEARPA